MKIASDLCHSVCCLWIASFALFGLSAVGTVAQDWEEEALLLYNSGSPEINDLRARSTGNNRLRTYAQALETLFREPMREESALVAQKRFANLIEVNPNDDVGLASAYYLAQIDHRYLDEPNLEAARSAYRSLYDRYPRRFFGELAFLKFALIEIYGGSTEEGPAERLKRLEADGKRLVLPDMRRGFHRSLGEAYRSFGLSESKAYEHLKVAYEIETSVPETQTELMLTVAELAEAHGDLGVAIAALQKFLTVAPSDERRTAIAQRMADLKRQLLN